MLEKVSDSFKLLSEVMEKMIDSQISNTQALTCLKDSVINTTERLKVLETFFTNGFRSDIRILLQNVLINKEQLEKTILNLDDVNKQYLVLQRQNIELQNKVDSYKRIGFWIKVIAGFFGAIAIIIAGLLKLA